MSPYSGFAARNLAGVAHGAAPAYFDPFEAALVFAVIRPPAGPHRMTRASPGIMGGRAGLADGHAVSVREGFRVGSGCIRPAHPQYARKLDEISKEKQRVSEALAHIRSSAPDF